MLGCPDFTTGTQSQSAMPRLLLLLSASFCPARLRKWCLSVNDHQTFVPRQTHEQMASGSDRGWLCSPFCCRWGIAVFGRYVTSKMPILSREQRDVLNNYYNHRQKNLIIKMISLFGLQIRSILFTDSSHWRSCDYKLLGCIISTCYHVICVSPICFIIFIDMVGFSFNSRPLKWSSRRR